MRREPYDADDIGFEVLCGPGAGMNLNDLPKTDSSRDNKSRLDVVSNEAAKELVKIKTAKIPMYRIIFPFYLNGRRLNIINPAYAGQIL